MAVTKVIRPVDLHDDDFDIVDNKVRVRPTIKIYDVKYVAPDSVITTQMAVDYAKIGRHYLSVAGIQGNIHLDFKMVIDSGPRRALYTLPPEAPTPVFGWTLVLVLLWGMVLKQVHGISSTLVGISNDESDQT